MVSLETGGQSPAVAVSADETVVALRSPMPVSAEALFAWHERPGAFERLTPGFQPATVVARSGGQFTAQGPLQTDLPLPPTSRSNV